MFLTIGILVLVYKNCESIPLPGVDVSAYESIEAPAKQTYLPYASGSVDAYSDNSVVQYRQSDNTVKTPSLSAASFGNANTILDVVPSTTMVPKYAPQNVTPKNTLENLLNSLYGNESWRKELSDLLNKNTTHLTDNFSPVTQDKNQPLEIKATGFFSNQVSVNNLEQGLHSILSQTESVHSGNHVVLSSKSKDKHTRIYKNGQSGNDHDILPTSRNTVATSPISSSNSIANRSNTTPTITQTPPKSEMHSTSPKENEKLNVDGFSENSYVDTGLFDPNSVNHMSYIYNPDKFGFVTQTGSSPANSDQKSTFDADVLNRNFMQESFGNSPPGVNGKFALKPEEHSARNDQTGAHSRVQPPIFDASTLNMRLLGGRNFVANVPVGVNREHADTTKQSQHESSMIGSESSANTHHENPIKTSQQTANTSNDSSPTELPKPHQPAYSFIPGDLYPGQQYSKQGALQTNNGPSFLHVQRMGTIDQTFNPNVLNAAQTDYNPNAISWISTRSIDISGQPFHGETHQGDFFIPQEDETTPFTPTTQKPVSGSTTPQTTHIDNEQTGFNPNVINTAQGQGSQFVPGQLMPDVSLYQKFNYGADHMNSNFGYQKQQPTTLDHQTNANNNNSLGHAYSNNVFNPNKLNSLMTYNGKDTLNVSSVVNMGSMLGDKLFDPNAANIGFGNVLGLKNGTGSGMASFGFFPGKDGANTKNSSQSFGFLSSGGSGGRFDPNAANVGFGSSNYGFGSLGGASSSSFSNGFDANKINQYFMQDPYSRGTNGTHANNGYAASTFMGSFDPDKVNTASYDPNKFNNLQLHFDPVDMLVKNPGLDKSTLQAAVFDPDKINSELTKLAMSPMKMFQANQGSKTHQDSNARANATSNHNNVHSSPYDPVKQLMQLASLFQPGTLGGNQLPAGPISSILNNPNVIDTTTTDAPTSSTDKTTTPVTTTLGSTATTNALTTSAPPPANSSSMMTVVTTNATLTTTSGNTSN